MYLQINYTCFTKDSEGLWGKKNTGQRITEDQVTIGENLMIRTIKALSGEREKSGGIAGTVGPPEIFRDPAVSRYVVGPCNVYAEYVEHA